MIALPPMSAPTRYAALRQACFSIAGGRDNTAIVGAIVFAKERNENDVLGDIAIVARYGETPEVMTGNGQSLTDGIVARQSPAVDSARRVFQIIRERWHRECPE
ncbi:hypothetical protein [Labrys miyagiensis]|uniref:hypothetical protein n=1 Tax=Labrys miyagiensis TaxID=346912 RepID=UPI0024E17334|nr:hypothetical protein [Labrys miyagiensis]